jgi:arabinogalactan oligomer/maltooligosaccharide transport system substrate-binding protein
MKANSSFRRGVSVAVTAIIIVILVVAVGAAVYYATVSTVKASTTTGTTTVTKGTTTTVTPPPAPVTLTVWETYAPSSTADSEFGAFNKSLTAFKAAYPYITVNVQTQDYSAEEADFVTASLANAAPDVIRIGNDWTGSLVAEGFLTPINSFVNSTFTGQYFPASIEDYQYQGHLYGLPENINGLALLYNKALVPTPPTTTDQLITMAQSITKYGADCKITTAGFVFNAAGGFGSGYWWWPFLTGFGGSVFSSTNPAKATINSTAAVNSVEWLNGLVTNPNPDSKAGCNGVMPPGATGTTATDMFLAGDAGMIIDGPWDVSTYTANKTLDFGVAALPTVSSTGLPLAPFIGSQGWAISSGQSAAVTAAAFKFISFITNYNSQYNLATMAGDLPANSALASSSAITSNPYTVGFLAQAKTSSPAVNTPEMSIVYADIGGPLGLAEPASATSPVSAATIVAQLNSAEASITRDIGSAA